MQKLPSPEYLDLTYRADLNLLVSRWMRHPSVAEMQHGYNLMLNAAATHGCVRWLIDARRRDHANQSGIPWMIEVFYPQLASRLEGRVFLAFLLAPMHLQALESDTSLLPLSYFDTLPYQIGRFLEERAAMTWLDTHCPVEKMKW
ncbi:hypothetical protein MUN82_16875 [Hymenobacter aerilatus]|uniref:Uncharacterized protein n=1 Tax=Hymenobacter aerilatus TaxID=2932251 RepID=A0A8T9SXV7_9BACT|nr:hypothetical protein [Hymenobacter aerilatus]UOR04609.1 hypothetical protein MUN82_16875 [Hymenobacter aerilatus]